MLPEAAARPDRGRGGVRIVDTLLEENLVPGQRAEGDVAGQRVTQLEAVAVSPVILNLGRVVIELVDVQVLTAGIRCCSATANPA
jgi:hypothetical protein